MTEKESMTITSTDGTVRKYVIIDDNATTVATGAALTNTSDTGAEQAGEKATATITVDNAGEAVAGGTISVITTAGDTVTITGHADTNAMGDTTGASTNGTFAANNTLSGGSTNNNTQAAAIAATINLHDDFSATASSAVVTITQLTGGTGGNTNITLADNGGNGDIQQWQRRNNNAGHRWYRWQHKYYFS